MLAVYLKRLHVNAIHLSRIVRQVVTETYENDDHFDITYIIIVWFAFLPTVIVPWFIAHWLLIGALKKDRFQVGAQFHAPIIFTVQNYSYFFGLIFNVPTLKLHIFLCFG